MTGALVILAAMVVVGFLLYVTDKKYFRQHHDISTTPPEDNLKQPINPTEEDICCGQHLVCEKTSLAVVSDEILYYDDEELDRFAGKAPESYSPDEIEEFRDILLTLLPEDVAGWARSMTLRNIQLPHEVREELLMIVTELRSA